MEAEVDLCWNDLPWEILHQRDEGACAEVDQLTKHLPTKWAWDELVFLPPPANTRMPCKSGHLRYIMGRVVDLGQMLPFL